LPPDIWADIRIESVPDPSLGVGEPVPGGAFGPNAWLVDDMYDQFRKDPESVSESWRDFFADYVPGGHGGLAGTGNGAASATPANGSGTNGSGTSTIPTTAPTTTAHPDPLAAAPAVPAPAVPAPAAAQAAPQTAPAVDTGPKPIVLSGASRRIAANMEASLGVPTATRVRTVPAKLLQLPMRQVSTQGIRSDLVRGLHVRRLVWDGHVVLTCYFFTTVNVTAEAYCFE